MSDIGDDLLRSVRRSFAAELGDSNAVLARLLKKIQSGNGTMADVSRFAAETGAALSRAISANVKPDDNSVGLYREAAEKLLQGTLRDNYDLINLVAAAAQEHADARLGVHLAPQKSAYPFERVQTLAAAAADSTAAAETIKRRLDAPVRNITESFYTDYVEANADFRSRAGMKTTITRSTNGKCCDWCASLAGHYEYPDVPQNIWAFHDNCTCTVVYSSAKTKSVHGKRGRVRYTEDLTYEEQRRMMKKFMPTRWTREQALQKQRNLLSGVAIAGDRGIIRSGAVSGALNPDSKEAQEHADQYYESVRHMTNDVNRIAQNTGFSVDLISQIKDFVFMQKHDLGGGKPEYFYPSYEMAQSWQRLIEGKNIQPHDLTLLNHEKMERELMAQGYSQNEAHDITSRVYNYGDESREYYANINKHSKNR